MAIRKIVELGEDCLRKVCKKQEKFDHRLWTLLDDMADTMYKAEGVGLAAPQIGVLRRVVVIDIGDGLVELINPVIVETSGTQCGREGCLSLPGLHEDVSRPVAIRMRWLDENFEEHDEEFDGYAARVIQHEYDHLEGKVFTDRLAPLRRNLLRSKLLGFGKGKFRAHYRTRQK